MPRNSFDNIDEEYYSTILEKDLSFNGVIKFDNSSIIKGHISGKIEAKGELVIGPEAVIDADITAKTIQCFGKINGNIYINEEAYFHNPSIINGNIKTLLLTLEKGCTLNGNVQMGKITAVIKDNSHK